MHASQIQGCVVEQRVEKKRKIAQSVWVHNVVTVWTVGCLTGWITFLMPKQQSKHKIYARCKAKLNALIITL